MTRETQHIPLSAIVLAAGSSTRTGRQNKLLLDVRGKPLILHVMDLVTSFPFFEVIVVTGYRQDQLLRLLSSYTVRCVNNSEFQTGMASSIVRGVSTAATTTSGFVFFLADMPFIHRSTVECLVETFLQSPDPCITIPVSGGRRGHPVIFPEQLKKDLLLLRGETGARSLLSIHSAMLVEVRVRDNGIFEDIDTLEDFDKLNH